MTEPKPPREMHIIDRTLMIVATLVIYFGAAAIGAKLDHSPDGSGIGIFMLGIVVGMLGLALLQRAYK